ncbi:hypothetical protein TSTA_096770 [Talaromyces stipitatus ATCC 10500]|uniref:Uncharacterized protein n=1 Tax=Talaromyces stipitatus (strain ATCC 10500 / CBS 375.48 / QM 6759 / NRRL 1006) TaxID=441959 RepID=B8LZK5_TALSN|nr:uncharacterized protein TSTA_096770 [Talaromyces stipitatus ATCC 10500]EED22428.1 hypothetical protein TSTA_096770 [Talaromyces stipitatus ATCC 10500]
MPIAYRTILTINNHLGSDLYDADPRIAIGSVDGVLPDYIRTGTQQTVFISAPGSFAGSKGSIIYITHNSKKDREEKLAFDFKCVEGEADYVRFSSTMPNQLRALVDPYEATDHPLYGFEDLWMLRKSLRSSAWVDGRCPV